MTRDGYTPRIERNDSYLPQVDERRKRLSDLVVPRGAAQEDELEEISFRLWVKKFPDACGWATRGVTVS